MMDIVEKDGATVGELTAGKQSDLQNGVEERRCGGQGWYRALAPVC